ncbi:MAG: Ribose 5-phosphate isomerase A [Candidatus Bipolaricaulis sibiricus]|uniref:Ribose-5-phosphate isomerase A n=1 Tax=Bipolaricaulis sibiricus TaxID=2501609 RepID=A0A410FW66_BIPS1|nr:MAG: Ribose 5-phosphate isomerase A [Candidatus Bipolaricaulis sibiricus]
MTADPDRFKRAAAEEAVSLVRSGMALGLGHGTTAHYALVKLAEIVRSGLLRDVVGVPCSTQVEAEARELGIPLTTLDEHPVLDLTIDGADEVDPALNLIKGGGGALLREKIVAQASRREAIVVDEGKLSPVLGTRCAVPVEVVPFGWRTQVPFLTALGGEVILRRGADGAPFRTDGGNLILDCRFGPISDPVALARALDGRAGIVGHGLFLRLATDLFVAGPAGVRHVKA